MFSIYPIEVDARLGVEESVNLRCIELHPHLALGDLDHPDEMRVDLDTGVILRHRYGGPTDGLPVTGTG